MSMLAARSFWPIPKYCTIPSHGISTMIMMPFSIWIWTQIQFTMCSVTSNWFWSRRNVPKQPGHGRWVVESLKTFRASPRLSPGGRNKAALPARPVHTILLVLPISWSYPPRWIQKDINDINQQKGLLCNISWHIMMKYDEIWWNMMKYDEIWWNMMKDDEIWWNMMKYGK